MVRKTWSPSVVVLTRVAAPKSNEGAGPGPGPEQVQEQEQVPVPVPEQVPEQGWCRRHRCRQPDRYHHRRHTP
jgi:hypothetical protein